MQGWLAAAAGCLAFVGPVLAADVVEYYHTDGIGNVRAVTNQAGQVIERHDYLPFGEECITGTCASNPGLGAGQPRKFTGKERDAETGLDYFGARYYGSRIGRFTTTDPFLDQEAALLDPQQWNRYVYGRNNPAKFVDPDGRHPVLIVLALAAAFVLNNPTNTNVTQGPVNDTIIPNSVIVAGGYGLAAGGARMAAKEVLQEAVENVTGLPVGGLPGRRATESGISVSRHSVNQKISRGMKSADELDAIKNPLDVKPVKVDELGRPSQRSIGRKAEVVRNPDTGQIVSVNPTSTKKAERLIKRNEKTGQ